MRTRIFPLLVVYLVCLFSVKAQIVRETDSSVILHETTADVSIVIDNPKKAFDGAIELVLLDAGNNIRARSARNLRIKQGRETYKLIVPLGDLMKTAGDDIAWFRLHYRAGQAEGFISLSEIIKDDFELRVAAAEDIFAGTIYRVRVRAFQPYTKIPVKNVKIEGGVKIELDTDADADELELKATAETDKEGFAVLDFKVSDGVRLDEGELKIKGRKNGIVREIEEDLETDNARGSIFLTTDKPLYQPGQSFNVRGLYFDASNTVVTNSELEFKIYDEDDTILYRETLKTSEYGIASISWQIPENAKLGSYRVSVEADDELRESELSFKVSRYDLPQFSVTAKPDKTFYLPADKQAEITVSADYLFGKPVTKGKVRLVQEAERRWNWREQKYDVEEKKAFEGEIDAGGKFIAKVDLSGELSELQKNDWQRFEDLTFAAYFTDTTTNRTEQRRFDLRLSKEAIHVYLIGNRYDENFALPVTTYVSTFYADGSPAVCDVEIKGKNDNDAGDNFKTLTRIKTNRFGGGKAVFFRPKFPSAGDDLDLHITARDKNGKTGIIEEEFRFDADDDALKIQIEKTIFKPGESVSINLLSSRKDALVYVDVVKNRSVVESRFVKLKGGKADLKIPYNENFKGDLIVAAYDDENESYYDSRMRASRGIIFPLQQNLRLDAEFSSSTYKPNEEAKVKFSVLDSIGGAVESALGVVVFDKAIEERARTDEQFGGYFNRFYGLLGYEKSFGGVSLKDLNELDLSKPVSGDLQLAAEIMLYGNYYYPRVYRSRESGNEAKSLYAEYFKKQLAPLETALKNQYAKNYAFPSDEAILRRIASENNVDFDDLRDPWGNKYQAVFTIEKTQSILTLRTAAADKKFDTSDDFVVSSSGFEYFTPVGKAIDKAAADYHRLTENFIRDIETLRGELARQNIDLNLLKDRWNRDYRVTFEISGRNYLIRFRSLGANGYFQPNDWNSDDFDVWKNQTDYFAETETAINKIFSKTVNAGVKDFPKTDAEFKRILKENDFDFERILDGLGNPVYLTYNKQYRYSDKTKIENGKQIITPVTEELAIFTIRSVGADKTISSDDYDLLTVSGVVSEQSKDTKYEKTDVKSITFSGAKGAVRGTVYDRTGALIPNATVSATDEEDTTKYFSATTDKNGEFLLENLPSGRYSIKAEASGFQSKVFSNIQVRSQNLLEIKFTLDVGTVNAAVSVEGRELAVDATASMSQTTVTNVKNPYVKNVEQNSTPRLREYFPETLLWNPELITDKKGKAELKFKLADNITTWKLYTIASTKNGKIGIAEKEIQAFQSFFVDLEPPKFLTEGDEIYLPAQIRNYTEKKQKVDVTMTQSAWFSFLNAEKQQIEVASGASENAVFGFKALAAIKDGKQRVTAISAKDSDAIEKPVTVRPNGQEIVRTDSKLSGGAAHFDVHFPVNALPKTQKAELKIYPNLMAHVTESVEGLLQRPYGCGEQTISSTYPNVMILKFTKNDSKLRRTAQKYLQKGYERLLGYQVADGGFSYWGGKDSADPALTVYALRFFNDAKEFVEVDEDVIKRAQTWLIGKQKPDGSWVKRHYWENSEDASGAKLLTSYIARTLAMSKQKETTVLKKALAYLKTRNAEIDEPYALALFGLASLDAGDAKTAAEISRTLEKTAIAEGNSVYWKLETNTPFYGWGTAGRIETTALVLQLLVRLNNKEAETQRENLISRGTQFLLKNKDRYGVWYSTQTTINVLDAFLAALSGGKTQSQNNSIQVFLNGENLKNISVSSDEIAPIVLDLNGKLHPEKNRVEIKSSIDSPLMSQIVAAHYIDWKDSEASGTNTNASRQMRLDYKCDRTNGEIMQNVNCAVEAERIGFQGYGMILAEIGLPPGADVSRESLQAAMDADWSLSRYDVLPDRIVLYMWSKAGGTKFNFQFRPRYGVNAQTPSSVVYDYYNPEAQAIVAPLKFSVK
ncbi:MAG: putative rane protein [Acidobacteria bacterium]|nr:putative rane protein [Acidobacteriota bacterium]